MKVVTRIPIPGIPRECSLRRERRISGWINFSHGLKIYNRMKTKTSAIFAPVERNDTAPNISPIPLERSVRIPVKKPDSKPFDNYRWYKGLILPSVDHLLMLSELLNVHMEDLLVKKNAVPVIYDMEQCYAQDAQKRFIAYYKKIYQSVA